MGIRKKIEDVNITSNDSGHCVVSDSDVSLVATDDVTAAPSMNRKGLRPSNVFHT